MAYSFQAFKDEVLRDNPSYESMYNRIGVRKSRLHDFVTWLGPNQHPTAAEIYTHMRSVPGNAWDMTYHNAKKYLVREFRLVCEFDMPGGEVPAGEEAVSSKILYTGSDHAIQGYGGQMPERASRAGLGVRPDGRFYWANEVVYTLHDSIDTSMYAPFRQVKDARTYADKGYGGATFAAKTELELDGEAGAKLFHPDGPRYYNVKRTQHTISVCDGPGIDVGGVSVSGTYLGVSVITADKDKYPIRHCAYFEMSLYVVKPGKDLANAFNTGDHRASIGSPLAGSRVTFHYVMSREKLSSPAIGTVYNP